MFVAVVAARRPSRHPVGIVDGVSPWSCFTAATKSTAIELAVHARQKWGTRDYVIWVGELTEEAVEPVQYELVSLDPGKRVVRPAAGSITVEPNSGDYINTVTWTGDL